MPILLDNDEHRAAGAVAVLPDAATIVPDTDALISALADRPDEYVVVLGPSITVRDAGTLAERMRTTHPSAGVVLIRQELSTAVFTESMAAGIHSVIAEGDGAGLRTAVERARRTWEAIHGPASPGAGHGGKIITVFSPKGGVGKTTLAVNLAVVLSQGSGPDHGLPVCIVDLDLAFGDVAITLQVVPQHTIDEAIGTGESLDFALLQQLLTEHSEDLSILAAPTRPDARERIPAELIARTLSELRRHFEYVVVDTAPGFDEAVLQALDHTDELVLVATLDVPAVKNMKMAVETLDLLDLVKEHRHLVLNRADDAVGLDKRDVEGILKLPIEAAIPTDIAVASATNHGRPIVLAHPDHIVSRAVADLARAVADRPLGDSTTSAGARRRGFLRRAAR
ncbi:MAG TPA: P-loop NTPase [Marmoricola sp.]